MIFEGSRYRGGFMYKTLAMSAIVSFCTGLPLNGGSLAEVISNPGGGTPIYYLYGYVPPNGVVILKLLI